MDNAEIRKRYETYAKQQVNFSPSANAIMEKIKNGYDPTRAEVFELITTDQNKINKYKFLERLRNKALNPQEQFTEIEFDSLIELMELKDQNLISALKNKFRANGRLEQIEDNMTR